MRTHTWKFALVILSVIMISSCKKNEEKPEPNTPEEIPADVTDIDGNVYKTVKIGTQIWMTENLKVKHYRNGDSIPTTTPDILNISHETKPKYQWAYNGDENNVSSYGRLYTWYAITDNRNICPPGWHIPSNAEWKVLISYVQYGGYGAGMYLKEIGTVHWDTVLHVAGQDKYGFCARPGGRHEGSGGSLSFSSLQEAGYWWTSTSDDSNPGIPDFAWYFQIHNSSSETSNYSQPKYNGISVRCIKD